MFENIDFSKFDEKTFLTATFNENVKKLYKIVENYYKSNYLKDNDNDVYYFSVDGIIYEIGFQYVYEDFYYIKRYSGEEYVKSHRLDDILNNRISLGQMVVKEKLDKINDYIEQLKQDGVSLKLIKKSINIGR